MKEQRKGSYWPFVIGGVLVALYLGVLVQCALTDTCWIGEGSESLFQSK